MPRHHRVDACNTVGLVFIPRRMEVAVADARVHRFYQDVVVAYGMAGELVWMEVPFCRIDGKSFGRDTVCILRLHGSH